MKPGSSNWSQGVKVLFNYFESVINLKRIVSFECLLGLLRLSVLINLKPD